MLIFWPVILFLIWIFISVLLKKAKKLESQGLQQSIVKPERAPVFEELLHNVLHIRHPKPIDYFNRIDLIRIFNVISKEIHGNLLFLTHPPHNAHDKNRTTQNRNNFHLFTDEYLRFNILPLSFPFRHGSP